MNYIPEPFPLERRSDLRRVYFSGHQMSYAAYWHGWLKEDGGIVGAVLETSNGSMMIERSFYCLTFVDSKLTT